MNGILSSWKSHVDYLIRYTLTSGIAVALEVVLFYMLFENGMVIFWANALSSVFGFGLGWIIGGRTLFRKCQISCGKYLLWFGYQAVAITMYSYGVKLFNAWINQPVSAKILFLLISFAINSYVFKAFILFKISKRK